MSSARVILLNLTVSARKLAKSLFDFISHVEVSEFHNSLPLGDGRSLLTIILLSVIFSSPVMQVFELFESPILISKILSSESPSILLVIKLYDLPSKTLSFNVVSPIVLSLKHVVSFRPVTVISSLKTAFEITNLPFLSRILFSHSFILVIVGISIIYINFLNFEKFK